MQAFAGLLILLTACAEAAKMASRTSGAACRDVYPQELDVAIYWTAPAAVPTPDHLVDFEKSCPELGLTSSNFNPAKPTVIFTHGLQPNFVANNDRFGQTSEIHPFILGWLQMGWNFGVFQWTQFADESVAHFERAEGKIWTTTYFADMEYTYLTKRNTAAVADAPTNETVADMFVRHYLAHFTPDRAWPNEIRLVGHSLGSQLVIVTMSKVISLQIAFGVTPAPGLVGYRVPDRVALLDPVVSPNSKPYLQDDTETDPLLMHLFSMGTTIMNFLSAMAMRATQLGVALEYYKSSFINRCLFSSHEDNLLVQSCAFETVHFTQFGDHPIGQCISDEILGDFKDMQRYLDDVQYQMAQSHIAIVPYYLMSFLQPPLQCNLEDSHVRGSTVMTCTPIPGKLALSAAMPTDDVLMYSGVVLGWSDSTDADADVVFPPSGPANLCFHEFVNNALLPRFQGQAQIDYTQVFDTANDLYYLKPCTHINT